MIEWLVETKTARNDAWVEHSTINAETSQEARGLVDHDHDLDWDWHGDYMCYADEKEWTVAGDRLVLCARWRIRGLWPVEAPLACQRCGVPVLAIDLREAEGGLYCPECHTYVVGAMIDDVLDDHSRWEYQKELRENGGISW